MGEEVDGVDPLGLSITSQEFFIEGDVSFGVDAGCGCSWYPFDSAVDVIVLEGFVEVPPVAEDTKSGVPAVKVPVLRVIRVRE